MSRFNISFRQKFMPSLIRYKKRISVSAPRRRRKSVTRGPRESLHRRTDDVFSGMPTMKLRKTQRVRARVTCRSEPYKRAIYASALVRTRIRIIRFLFASVCAYTLSKYRVACRTSASSDSINFPPCFEANILAARNPLEFCQTGEANERSRVQTRSFFQIARRI